MSVGTWDSALAFKQLLEARFEIKSQLLGSPEVVKCSSSTAKNPAKREKGGESVGASVGISVGASVGRAYYKYAHASTHSFAEFDSPAPSSVAIVAIVTVAARPIAGHVHVNNKMAVRDQSARRSM